MALFQQILAHPSMGKCRKFRFGDFSLAVSVANRGTANPDQPTQTVQTVPNDRFDPIFEATVQAVEEAIVNALVDNRTMRGRDGHRVYALPYDRLRQALKNTID